MSFAHEVTVRLARTDAAGVLFFAEQLALCHEAYEALLDDIGWPVKRVLGEGQIALPIVHASIDLEKPVFVGDVLRIEIALGRMGTTSFGLAYALSCGGARVGGGETVHVCIDRETRDKVPLPGALSDALKAKVSAPAT